MLEKHGDPNLKQTFAHEALLPVSQFVLVVELESLRVAKYNRCKIIQILVKQLFKMFTYGR